METKYIHTFVVADKDGKDQKFLLKKPSRREANELAKFFKIKFNNLQKEGFLTKRMIMAAAEEHGNGLLSKDTAQKMTKLRVELQTIQAKIIEAQIKYKDNTVKEQETLLPLYEKLAEVNENLVGLESYYQSSFEYSVESQAEAASIRYAVYFFSYVEKNGVIEPYFKGATFEEKEDYDFSLEDDEAHETILGKLLTYYTLYYKGVAENTEDFATIDKRLAGQQEEPATSSEEGKEQLTPLTEKEVLQATSEEAV